MLKLTLQINVDHVVLRQNQSGNESRVVSSPGLMVSMLTHFHSMERWLRHTGSLDPVLSVHYTGHRVPGLHVLRVKQSC